MAKNLFRKSEAELGTSPEQLQDYVRVTNPLVWTVLVAVVLLLGGGIIAATFGKVEVTMNAFAFVESGNARIDLAIPDAYKLQEGMTVRFTEQKTEAKISTLTWISDDLLEATFAVDLPDATTAPYSCIIVTGTVSPISFLID